VCETLAITDKKYKAKNILKLSDLLCIQYNRAGRIDGCIS